MLPAPEDLPFPHVSQVLLIERRVTDLRGQRVSAVAALGVASPAPDQASPADLAGYVRGSGRSSLFTGCVTPCTKRTNPRSEPEMAPGSWLLSATSQSGHSEWPDAPTSPKPPDGPDAPWTAHSPSSDSHHDLGTAVASGPRTCWHIEGTFSCSGVPLRHTRGVSPPAGETEGYRRARRNSVSGRGDAACRQVPSGVRMNMGESPGGSE